MARPKGNAGNPTERIVAYRLAEVLRLAQNMLVNGDLDLIATRAILRTLAPFVWRHHVFLRQEALERQSKADHSLAADLLAVLRHHPAQELSRTQIYNLLWRNTRSSDITRALQLLQRQSKAEMRLTKGRGQRPLQLWRATAVTEDDRVLPNDDLVTAGHVSWPSAGFGRGKSPSGRLRYHWGGLDERPADRAQQPPAPAASGRGPTWADDVAAHAARFAGQRGSDDAPAPGKAGARDYLHRGLRQKVARHSSVAPVRKGPVWK